MRHIQKRRPPSELLEHCKSGEGVNFGNSPKQSMRQALRDEQSELCAYCMCHLDGAGEKDVKIEHRVAQTTDGRRALEWSNLLGTCFGGEGRPREEQTCDTRKRDREIPFDPTRPEIEREIRYTHAGRIEAVDVAHQQALDEILGLNHPDLETARRETLDLFVRTLQHQRPVGAWTNADLATALDNFRRTRKGTTRAFLGIAEWYVRLKQRRSSRAGSKT